MVSVELPLALGELCFGWKAFLLTLMIVYAGFSADGSSEGRVVLVFTATGVERTVVLVDCFQEIVLTYFCVALGIALEHIFLLYLLLLLFLLVWFLACLAWKRLFFGL